jgi:hypothetical protein
MLNVNAVNCIYSHVWSPQYTSLVGSGFALLAVELSYHADVFSFVPFGSTSGDLKTWSVCQLKSYWAR